MRKSRILILALLTASVVVAAVLLVPRWGTPAKTIVVALDPQLDGGHGIGYGGARSAASGYLLQAGKVAGLRFSYVRTRSREESFAKLLSGQVDIVPAIVDVPQAVEPTSVLMSTPYYQGATVIVSRARGQQYSSLNQLSGRTLAVRSGGEYEHWLKQHRPDIKLRLLTDLPDVLGTVESGAADAALGMDAIYRPILRRDFSRSLEISGVVDELPISVRAIVRADNLGLLTRLDMAVRALSTAQHLSAIENWLELTYRPAPRLSSTLRQYWLELLLGGVAIASMAIALVQARRSRNVARSAEREKSRILAVMSHEIRNSANALQSAVDHLARKPALESQRKYLDAAVASSTSLSLLLNNALEYSRLEAGHFVSNPASTDVLEVARSCVLAFTPQANEKGLNVEVETPRGPPPMLMVDELLLRQILVNLISNAVKFCDEGSVTVLIGVSTGADGRGVLDIQVRDTGPGMSADTVARLFRQYAQDIHARSRGGAGLGLSICRDIVRRLDGEISVQSDPASGSRFDVLLPVQILLDVQHPPKAAPSDVDRRTERKMPRSVLLVEDHTYSAMMMEAQLGDLGCETVVATTGSEAISAFENAPRYDLCLLDCNLPDTDGYALARSIRNIEATRQLAPSILVAVSALAGQEHESRCLDAGFNSTLTKPISRAQLEDLVQTGVATPMSELLQALFWEHYSKDLSRLQAASGAGDWPAASVFTHRICGSAAVAGQTQISSIARELMDLAIAPAGDDTRRARWDTLVAELRSLEECGTTAGQHPRPH